MLHYWDGANPLLLGYMDSGSRETRKLEHDFITYFPRLSFDYTESRGNFILGIEFPMVSNFHIVLDLKIRICE